MHKFQLRLSIKNSRSPFIILTFPSSLFVCFGLFPLCLKFSLTDKDPSKKPPLKPGTHQLVQARPGLCASHLCLPHLRSGPQHDRGCSRPPALPRATSPSPAVLRPAPLLCGEWQEALRESGFPFFLFGTGGGVGRGAVQFALSGQGDPHSGNPVRRHLWKLGITG